MNYWLLTTEFPPFFGGGISTYCLNTAEMLAEQGYSVTVITPDSDAVSSYKQETINKYTVVRFNLHHSKFSQYMGYYAYLSYRFAEVVEELINQGNIPNIIESQDYLGISYYLLQFKLLKQSLLNKIPVIITLHSPAFLYLDTNRVPVYKFPDFQVCEMEKQAIVSADMIISPTRFIYNEVKNKLPVSPEKIKIIPNPFAVRSRSPETLTYKKNKIVFYGKLSVQKGALHLLEYFKEIWNTSDLQLVLVGGTDILYYPEMNTMGNYVTGLYKNYINSGRLIIKDKISPGELKGEVEDAHVVVIPSVIDNLPYALLENMALGKIVLASVQGGQAEVIQDEENGFLFDHDLPGDFSKKLFSILSEEKEKLQKISNNAIVSITSSYSFHKIFPDKHMAILELKNTYHFPSHFPFLYQEHHTYHYRKNENDHSLLSIVIPYYNMGSYLMETLQSIKDSQYSYKEIIIVNDGSDEAESIDALSVAEKNYGCKIINTSNKGLAEARNSGANASVGKYLAFLDPDDKVAPGYYSKAIYVLEKFSNVYGVGCFVKYFEKRSSYWITSSPQPPYILAHNSINSSALVYKRNAFLEAGLNDKKVDYGLEDYESVISMISRGYNLVVLPEVLFYYRVRKNSMFRAINRNKFLYSYKYIAEKHAPYFREHSIELINILNANGPGFLFDNPGFERRVFSVQSMRSVINKKVSKNSVVYRFAKKMYLLLAQKLK